MRHTYSYKVSGVGRDGAGFCVEGTVTCEFHRVFEHALRHTVHDLNPTGSCSGPYQVLHLQIDREPVVVHYISPGSANHEQAS